MKSLDSSSDINERKLCSGFVGIRKELLAEIDANYWPSDIKVDTRDVIIWITCDNRKCDGLVCLGVNVIHGRRGVK